MFKRNYNIFFGKLEEEGMSKKEIDKRIFFFLLKDESENILFYGLAVIVILTISSLSWWSAAILTGLFALIVLIDMLTAAYSIIIFFILSPVFVINKQFREKFGHYWYNFGSQIIRIITSVILINYTMFLIDRLNILKLF